MPCRRKPKGFTLIELLVVIAIIGILAVIVLLALGTARTKARDARAQSDLRSVVPAMEMYNDSASHGNGNYPNQCAGVAATAACWDSAITDVADFIGTAPTEPGTGYEYKYCATSDLQKYHLEVEQLAAGAVSPFVIGVSSCI